MSDELPRVNHARNPFVVALWVLSGVLLALGVLGVFASQQYLSASNYGYSGEPPLLFLLAQLASFLAPSVATGGFVCAALALAVSALHRYGAVVPVRAQDGEQPMSADAAGAAVDPDSREIVGPRRGAPASASVSPFAPRSVELTSPPDYRPPTTDHERFMRPSSPG